MPVPKASKVDVTPYKPSIRIAVKSNTATPDTRLLHTAYESGY